MELTLLMFARHGETDWNRDRRFQGHADPPLNAAGRTQAEDLARSLAGEQFDAIYCSDLLRAHETATIVGTHLELRVTPCPGLREIDVGSWSGLTVDEISERFPGGYERWLQGEPAHDGETREQLTARVTSSVRKIVGAHAGGRLLLVAHGGVIRSVQRVALGAPNPVVANCGTWQIACGAGEWRRVD